MGNGSQTNKPDGCDEAVAKRLEELQSQIRSCCVYAEKENNQIRQQVRSFTASGGPAQGDAEADPDSEPLVVVLCAPDSFHRTADAIRKMADAISQTRLVVLDAYHLPWFRERLGNLGKEIDDASIGTVEALSTLYQEWRESRCKRRTVHSRLSHRGRFRAHNQKAESLRHKKLQHIQFPFQRIRRKTPPCNRY